jgi:nitrogen fixation/metabolism regulation signal transduction histidine kinase
MTRLRDRLIIVFLAATLVPLALTFWMTTSLLRESLAYTSTRELDELSKSLEITAREYYKQAREQLKAESAAGRLQPQVYKPAAPLVDSFWMSGEPERFALAGEAGSELQYFVRRPSEVLVYTRKLPGVGLRHISGQYARARQIVENSKSRDLRRGFTYTYVLLTSAIWTAALILLVYSAHRISRPIRQLTSGLGAVAAGDLSKRVAVRRDDEIGRAVEAFNNMAEQLERSRERLVYVTRLASWQALARKTAHEIKNSLTPIRLTMEEIAARAPGDPFMQQASQIVVDEVSGLERRVRAFSDFAAEPPVKPELLDLNALLEERVSFLRNAHPEVIYNSRLAGDLPPASADPDLIKGVLTNLLENAAHAAGPGGVVLARTGRDNGRVCFEVHDSGPGLSAHARETLFEPTISFKKGGMGLGLSIARRSALLCGGDIVPLEGELGGAGFRVVLPTA